MATILVPENAIKRPAEVNPEDLVHTQAKRQKTTDNLRDHLPELHDEDCLYDNEDMAEVRKKILKKAKKKNILGLLPKQDDIEPIYYDYLRWSVYLAKSEQTNPSECKNAIFIVEKETTIEAHGQYIGTHIPGASCSTNVFSRNHKSEARHSDVLVVTPLQFLKALSKGTLIMQQFHSLVIEDVQPIRMQGCYSYVPIVQVMNNFYLTTPAASRPRILAIGLLSNLSSNNFDSKLLRLELLLDCRTYSLSKERRLELSNLRDRPSESVVLYDQPTGKRAPQRCLTKKLLEIDPQMRTGRRFFREAEIAGAKLGSAASDLTWKASAKEIGESIPTWQENEDFETSDSVRVRMRSTIDNWTFAMPNLNPTAPGFNVTHRFLRLIQILEACGSYGESFTCIIFTQHRSTAFVLAELLRMLGDKLPFVRPVAVSNNMGFNVQHETFINFATGRYNLLVATKSVEDLGLPEASVVIRFDLFDGEISHACVQACTLGRESQLINLVERNSDTEKRLLRFSTMHSIPVMRWMDTFNQTPRLGVPPECVSGSSQTYLEDPVEDEAEGEYILHPTTGGRIYPQHGLSVLVAAVSRMQLPITDDSFPLFDFQLKPRNKTKRPAFTCSINLPGTAIDGIVGPPAPSQYLARRFASYEACRRLFFWGMLGHHVIPLPPSRALREGSLEKLDTAKQAGTRRYARQDPFFWTHGNRGLVDTFYPAVITVASKGEPYAPLVLLTRQPLPPFIPFNLFQSGDVLPVKTICGGPFEPSEEMITSAHGFTLRVFRSLLNKPISCSMEDMAYFLAPLVPSWSLDETMGATLPVVEGSIDWELMKTATQEKWAVPIKRDDLETLKADVSDAIVQDRWIEFTRRYNVVKVRPDLSPLSKPDASDREAGSASFLDYVASTRKEFGGIQDNNQPLIEVDKVLSVLNNLSPRVKDLTPPSKAPAKYLIPELCGKFVFPASMFRTMHLIPSIMWKLDDLLVVKEMNNRYFQNSIREDLLCEALTTVSAGMEQDYERLELLGDAFLKYVSSVFVFVVNATQNEGSLHVSRQQILSNRALLQASTRVNTPPYIRSSFFNVRTWMPPNYVSLIPPPKDKKIGVSEQDAGEKDPSEVVPAVHEEDAAMDVLSTEDPVAQSTSRKIDTEPTASEPHAEKETSNLADGKPKKKKKPKKKGTKPSTDEGILQTLGDKTIADVAEALMGAAYVSGGRECALNVLKVLTVPMPGINTWADFGARVVIPLPHRVAQLRPGSLQAVGRIIGHRFQQPHLLAQAMTHTSVKTSEMTSYERLEFLGDAILDFMVVRYIYDRDHALSPGGLTLLKSAMVANTTLAAICVSSGLHEHLLYESQQLAHNIQAYVSTIKRKAEEERQSAEAEQRPAGQYWTDVEPPKALSDLIESLIGAVYISDRFSPVGAEAFFDNVLRPFFDQHITLQTLTHHPTKTLFELVQAHGCQMMKLTKEVKDIGTACHVMIHDDIIASATRQSTTSAARHASSAALDVIRTDANVLARICDCRGRAKDKNTWMAQGFDRALSSLIAEERSEED